ncbi:MAG: hypothetical protein RLW62_10810, partial [Gammaproteobacteria bacterium]
MTPSIAALFLALAASTHAAPWAVRTARDGSPPRAEIVNAAGARLAVFRDAAGAVVAEFRAAAPSPLAAGHCPTFQVDARLPLHHYPPGEDCAVDGRSARFTLVRDAGPRVESDVLYQLMNGSQVAFRFTTRDGAYHEARFPLTRSKNALRRALGRNLDVRPAPATMAESR